MKALVADRYGTFETLAIRDVPVPEPGAGEILIRVLATTVNRTDTATRTAHPFFARAETGLLRPNFDVFGLEFSGIVEALGPGASKFAKGDAVFGLSPTRFGCHAEFLCLPEAGPVAEKPQHIPHLEAVVCEGAWYAEGSVGDVGPGDDVLIYGASGAIGLAALQRAKMRGARVTAVVGPEHLHLAKSLGADTVVDFTVEEFTALAPRFDIVLDAVGKTSFFACRGLLKPLGVFRATDLGPFWSNIWLGLWSQVTGSARVSVPFPVDPVEFVRRMASWLDEGAYRSVVDRVYPFAEIAEAYAYVASGRKTGVVVVDMAPAASRRQRFVSA